MGFHADRPVVGLRVFIVMAVLLGVCLLVIGYYALFDFDLTNQAGGPRRDASGRPSIVQVLLTEGGPGIVDVMPALRKLRDQSLWAQEVYVTSWHAGTAHSMLYRDSPVGNDLSSVGYFGKQYPAPAVLFGDQFSVRAGTGKDVQKAVEWLRDDARRIEPFFLTVVLDTSKDNWTDTDTSIAELVQALQRTGLWADSAFIVTALAGDTHAPRPERWRVPLIVHYPRRIVSSAMVSQPVSLHDLTRTVEDIAGLRGPAPARLPHASLFSIYTRGIERSGVVVYGDITRSFGVALGAGSAWVLRDPRSGRITGLDGTDADPALVAALERYTFDTS